MLMTSLPVPEQWTLCKLTDREVAEEIEKLIDFVDESGRSVHLPMEFVRHYTTRHDGVLPTVVAIATLPIVLADGGVLGEERGFDEMRGISFIIPREVMALLPEGAVTDEAVAREMTFLTDKWLGDVATDYAGKCVIIAIALSIIERSLLDSRPTFFVTAGRRGSGKTTTLIMLIKAVTGIWPAAAAWSSNEEERRKALLSYFLSGVSYILWDNIPRGTQISCPHIERSCTSAFYIDRRLGVSEAILTAAGAIHLFTGNAIGAKGDMASRSLTVQLTADRPDPENRAFKHPDPVAWTDAHRVEILRALAGQSDAKGAAQRGDADAVQDVVASGRLRGRACGGKGDGCAGRFPNAVSQPRRRRRGRQRAGRGPDHAADLGGRAEGVARLGFETRCGRRRSEGQADGGGKQVRPSGQTDGEGWQVFGRRSGARDQQHLQLPQSASRRLSGLSPDDRARRQGVLEGDRHTAQDAGRRAGAR
jgi:hypothetical protein